MLSLQIGYTTSGKMEIQNKHTDFEGYAQRFYAFLDTRRMNRSAERGAILRAIFDCDKPFTADSLLLRLEKKKSFIARSTVYANLGLLVEAGLITKCRFPKQRIPIFEKSFHTNSQNYIYIIDTQKVIEFEDERIDEIKKELAEKYNIDVINHSFTIHCNKKIINNKENG